MEEKSHLPRWIAIVGFLGLGGVLIDRAVGTESLDSYLGNIAMAICLIVIGLALVVPDVFRLIGRVVDGFFFPGGKLAKPTLSYKLPEFYRREQRFEDALRQYDLILRHYPREARAWIGAIEVLIIDFGNRAQAEDYYRRARRKLRSDRDSLDEVRRAWENLRGQAPVLAR